MIRAEGERIHGLLICGIRVSWLSLLDGNFGSECEADVNAILIQLNVIRRPFFRVVAAVEVLQQQGRLAGSAIALGSVELNLESVGRAGVILQGVSWERHGPVDEHP